VEILQSSDKNKLGHFLAHLVHNGFRCWIFMLVAFVCHKLV